MRLGLNFEPCTKTTNLMREALVSVAVFPANGSRQGLQSGQEVAATGRS